MKFGISIISHYLSDRITVWLSTINYSIQFNQKMQSHLQNILLLYIVMLLFEVCIYCSFNVPCTDDIFL